MSISNLKANSDTIIDFDNFPICSAFFILWLLKAECTVDLN